MRRIALSLEAPAVMHIDGFCSGALMADRTFLLRIICVCTVGTGRQHEQDEAEDGAIAPVTLLSAGC